MASFVNECSCDGVYHLWISNANTTMSVDPFDGLKYPRSNYCTRGARFGVHSSEENFNNPKKIS